MFVNESYRTNILSTIHGGSTLKIYSTSFKTGPRIYNNIKNIKKYISAALFKDSSIYKITSLKIVNGVEQENIVWLPD